MENRKEALRLKLAAGRAKLQATIASLDDADWDRPTRNPEWTARDLLIHLANAESGLLGRMRRFLDGTSQLPPGFDLSIWNTRQVAKRQGEPVASLVAALDQSREQVLAFLDELSDDQFDIRGWHASGTEMTLAEMFEIVAWHEGTHAEDIATARS
jgi:uncharacterized protein (TIGR03083 family)